MHCGGSVVVRTRVTIVHAWLLCHCSISLVGTVHCLLALISCFHYISILAGLLVSEPQHRIQCINISCLNHPRIRSICIDYTSESVFIYFKVEFKLALIFIMQFCLMAVPVRYVSTESGLVSCE